METLVAYTNLSAEETAQLCPVIEHHGRTIQLKSPEHVAIGSAVKIETDNTLALGEVSCCHPQGDGYVVCVELFQALRDVDELSRLARALLA